MEKFNLTEQIKKLLDAFTKKNFVTNNNLLLDTACGACTGHCGNNCTGSCAGSCRGNCTYSCQRYNR